MMILKNEIMIKIVNTDEEESLQITSYVTQSDDDDDDDDDREIFYSHLYIFSMLMNCHNRSFETKWGTRICKIHYSIT